MSLYYVQKVVYELNRDERKRQEFLDNPQTFLSAYELTDEETAALRDADIGLLYVMGVNGQLLMHFAAFRGYEWDAYIQSMKDGLQEHGDVRTGLYVSVDGGQGGAV